VDRERPPALAALCVLLPFGNDGAGVTARANQVRLANDTPGIRTLLPNLDIPFGNPDLHVVHIEDDVVFRAILDDAIPRAASQSLAFRPITATARPPD